MQNNVFFQKLEDFWKSKDKKSIEIYTSGTTGIPKPFTIEKKHLFKSSEYTNKILHFLPNDCSFCCLPLDKIGGLMQWARSKVYSHSFEFIEPTLDVFPSIKDYHTIFSFTPLQIESILNYNNHKNIFTKDKKILIGGGILNNKTIEKIKQWESLIIQTYGSTETYSHIAYKNIKLGNHYTVFDGIKIKTDNNDLLSIKTPYKNDWINTQDKVIMINDNQFQFLSRNDFIINTGGAKVYPEEVEDYIFSKHNVKCIIAGVDDEILGQKIVCAIENEKVSLEDITENWELENYKKPKKIFYINNNLYLPGFKYNKKEIIKWIKENN